MKKLFLLFILAFTAISCEELQDFIDPKGHGLVFLEGDMKAYFDDKGDTKNYKFKADLAWSAEVSADWVEVDPTSGPAGENKIQIKVDKNKSDERRTGYVDIILSNDKSYRIELEQMAAGENLDDVIQPTNSCPSNEIWYTNGSTTEPTTPYNTDVFGANIVSNTFDADNECWVIGFDGDVTTIGDGAFWVCDSLISVTIPDSVTTIGDYAFGYCSNLTSVTIPDSVTEIGRGAFGECENLEAVHITDLVSWCNIDFINPLTDGRVDLNANPLCYAHNLYLNGELVTDLVIPDGVNEIKFMAFALCESIKSVTIGNGVTTIGDWVFYNCTSLTSVTILDSVTTIGYAAFYNCWSLTSVTIGDSVTAIGDYAFLGCSSLTSVTIGDSVTTIGDGAFWGCWSLTSVTIPDSVTTIGDRAFYYCSSLTSVFCKAINPPTTIVNNNGYWYGFAKEDESGNICNIDCTIYVYAECVEAYKNADGWNEYADIIVADGSIPEDTSTSIIRYTTIDGNPITPHDNMAVKSNTYINGEGILEFYGNIIGDYAFYYCNSLTSVTIGDSVTEIGEMAFSGCSSLTSVTIPDNVTSIGNNAFAGCSSLTSITIPNSVTTIGGGAFSDCSSLSKFNGKYASEDGRCLIIGGTLNSFASVGLTEYTIPDSVTTIGYSAFSGCSSLTSITIPDIVTTIGDSAFIGCSSLTSITIPDSVTTIGWSAFCDCSSLTSVTIPNSVTIIGDSAFLGCSSLTSITIPDSVTLIGEWAFNRCISLTSVTIPDSVTTIRGGAFYNCISLTSVTIPDSVTTIGRGAFANCSSLTSAYCKAITPPVALIYSDYDWYAFEYNAPGRKIYVPMESVEAYKSAEGWSEYADAIEGYDF